MGDQTLRDAQLRVSDTQLGNALEALCDAEVREKLSAGVHSIYFCGARIYEQGLREALRCIAQWSVRVQLATELETQHWEVRQRVALTLSAHLQVAVLS